MVLTSYSHNKGASSRDWNSARPAHEPNTTRNVFGEPLRMAEPRHRQVPPAVTSGQSIRRFQEKSPLLQVKEICLFYMKKCSGKYDNNKAAARYVHHMAEEIVQQLAGIAGEIRRNKGEPELYQALLDEWNDNFPPSLGAMGSPKAIASLVSQQSSELTELREALDGERSRREKDVTDILKSMDAQLQAYKTSVMSERQHQLIMEQQRQAEQAAAIEDLKARHRSEIDRLVRSHAQEMKSSSDVARHKFDDAADTIAALQHQIDVNRDLHTAELSSAMEKQQRRYDRLDGKYSDLKSKYHEMVEHLRGEFSVLGSSLDDDDENDDGISSDSGNASYSENGLLRTPSLLELRAEKQQQQQQQQQRKAAIEAKRQELLDRIKNSEIGKGADQYADLSSTAAAAGNSADFAHQFLVRQMSAQIEELKAKGVRSKEQVAALCSKIEELTSDLDVYHNRYTELEKLYHAVRRALSAHLDDCGILDSAAIRNIEALPFILAHTPHFLGPADNAGLEANRMINIAAYDRAGKF